MNREDVDLLLVQELNPHCPSVQLEDGEIVYQHKFYPYQFKKDLSLSNEGLGLFSIMSRSQFMEFIQEYLSIKDITVLCTTSKEMNLRCSNEKYVLFDTKHCITPH